MLAGNKVQAVLAASLHATVMQIMSPKDTYQVYSFVSSLLLQPHHNMFQCSKSPDQQRKCCLHIKAAILIGGGALYTALFDAAEQVAGDPNGGHQVF